VVVLEAEVQALQVQDNMMITQAQINIEVTLSLLQMAV